MLSITYRYPLVATLMLGMGLTACSKPMETKTLPSPTASPTKTTADQASSDTVANATAVAAAEKSSNDAVANNERLGTRWGDEVTSEVTKVELKRLSNTPLAQLQVRYADKAFTGKSLNDISLGAGQVSFSVTDDSGRTLPMYRAGTGSDTGYYVSAQNGQSYQLHYQNHTGKTYEIVASVDGLDVLNGSTASRNNDGYVLSPNDSLTIEGFRKSQSAVASFIFSKPKDAYANHNKSGSIDNTGIIGTVVYELKAPNKKPATTTGYAPPPTAKPNAFPADK